MLKMNDNFGKRIYTPSLFASDILYLASHLPEILRAVRSKSVSRKFAEKIMTVITAVNGCVYCSGFMGGRLSLTGSAWRNYLNL